MLSLLELIQDKTLQAWPLLLGKIETRHRQHLSQVNGNKPEHEWSIYYIKLAPHASKQNPIEAVWLKAKNFLRHV